VRPLGGREERRVDVRIMAATHRNLQCEIEAQRFRADLFYRLRVLPLRDRPQDIEVLVLHFLEHFAKQESKPTPTLSPEALQLLEAHTWPGNVRELENEVHRALALSDRLHLTTADFAIDLTTTTRYAQDAWATRTPGEPLRETLERVEAWLVRRALQSHAGRKTETARNLGLTREGLYKKMKRLGVE
jgi:DNA-binding NtrC family response regulator